MEWTTKMEGGGSLYMRDDGHFLYFEANRPHESGIFKVILQGMGGGQVLGTMELKESGLKLCRMVSRSTIAQWGCLPLTKVICQRSYPPNPLKETAFAVEDVLSPMLLAENYPVREEKEENIPVEENSFQESDSMLEKISHLVEELSPLMDQKSEIPPEEEVIWTEVPAGRDFFPCSRPDRGIVEPILVQNLRGVKGVLRQEGEEGFALAMPYFPDKAFPLTPLFCLGRLEEIFGRDYVVFHFSKEGRPLGLPLL